MPMADTKDRLAEELSGPIADLGLDLEAVDLSSAGKRRVLRFAIDKDGGVTMDDIADATTEISRVLDDTNLMGEQPFTLEVSSPGVERPLTLPRHWRRNNGRLVTVTLGEGDPLTGRITVTDDDGALLEIEGAERRVEYAEVRKAKIQIEFKKEST
ncbi:MAG: rimP [Marmoricola sp.]|nr:rimP [Marmoricola sp.]